MQSEDVSWIVKLKTEIFKRLLIMNKKRINKDRFSSLLSAINRKYNKITFLFYERHFNLEIPNRNY